MKGLARLALGLGERRGAWGALLATEPGVHHVCIRAQAAGIAAAATGNNGSSSGGGISGGGSSEPPPQLTSPRPSPPSRLDKLQERFKVGP